VVRPNRRGPPGPRRTPAATTCCGHLVTLVKEIAGFGTPRVHPVMREQFSTLACAVSGSPALSFGRWLVRQAPSWARAIAPRLRNTHPREVCSVISISTRRMATSPTHPKGVVRHFGHIFPRSGRPAARALPDRAEVEVEWSSRTTRGTPRWISRLLPSIWHQLPHERLCAQCDALIRPNPVDETAHVTDSLAGQSAQGGK
jgi:hypothetical protein